MTTPDTHTDSWVPALTFASKLALVRHEKGWNIKEAALACGISPQSWRGWELEGRLPHDQLSIAEQIAEVTGVSQQWLLFGKSVSATGERVRPAHRDRHGRRDVKQHLPRPARRATHPQPSRPATGRPKGRPDGLNPSPATRRPHWQ